MYQQVQHWNFWKFGKFLVFNLCIQVYQVLFTIIMALHIIQRSCSYDTAVNVENAFFSFCLFK